MNNKIKYALIAIVSLMVIGVGSILTTPYSLDDGTHQNLKYDGYVNVDVKKAGTDTWQPLASGKHNLLVTNGKNYIQTQIGNGNAVASNSTKYISLSNDATSPDAAWTVIPTEIASNGLTRATATYLANGTGAWNYTYTWTATGAQSAQLTGLNYAPANDGNLFAALQFTAVSLVANDQLRVIWSISVS